MFVNMIFVEFKKKLMKYFYFDIDVSRGFVRFRLLFVS